MEMVWVGGAISFAAIYLARLALNQFRGSSKKPLCGGCHQEKSKPWQV